MLRRKKSNQGWLMRRIVLFFSDVFFLFFYNLWTHLHANGMECPTADVTIRGDRWSKNVTRAVDASSWDTEHERWERRKVTCDTGSSFYTKPISASFFFVPLDFILCSIPNGQQRPSSFQDIIGSISILSSSYIGCKFLPLLLSERYRGRKDS